MKPESVTTREPTYYEWLRLSELAQAGHLDNEVVKYCREKYKTSGGDNIDWSTQIMEFKVKQ